MTQEIKGFEHDAIQNMVSFDTRVCRSGEVKPKWVLFASGLSLEPSMICAPTTVCALTASAKTVCKFCE